MATDLQSHQDTHVESKGSSTDVVGKIGSPVRSWHTLTANEVGADFGVDSRSGLSVEQVRKRATEFGPNRLRQEKQESILEMYLKELREPMILLLLGTGVLYSLWGELQDTLTIFVVILTLVSVEVFNDRRADKAIASLRKLSEPTASVLRSGQAIQVPAEDLVPGDVILLGAGHRVPADARLVEAYGLAVDEASLTGESVPVEKEADVILPDNTPLAERRNLVLAGTTVTRGRGAAIVDGTGMATEIGRVAKLAQEVEKPRTPLQQTLDQLTRSLVWLALGFSVVVPLLGWLLAGQSLQQMVLTGLALAFSVIPEELPIIVTMVLALGGYRMAQQHAIVKDLRAVETLGAVTAIATDKTGTLTENRMEVSRLSPESQSRKLLELGVLCNDAAENDGQVTGDPVDVALIRAARAAGVSVDTLRRQSPLQQEFTFDNSRKMMSVVSTQAGTRESIVKGAPEPVLARSTFQQLGVAERPLVENDRQALLATAMEMAAQGLRVLAFATRALSAGKIEQAEAESNLVFVGLAGFADPPRVGVKEAIADCRAAGIRTLMVSGDHPLTAGSIARQIGLDGNAAVLTGAEIDALSDQALHETVGKVSIYARVTPENKLRIVRALRERGAIVAATGDGINDAPALAAADIGIAMGETGTDVAREAADIVLADDHFATIVSAIREGRTLFANLTKGVRYYLACKVALVSVTLLPVLLRVPIPFAPVQIIVMELFMDLAASATFVSEPAESDLMQQPPRNPRAKFMDRAMVTSIFQSSAGLFAAVSLAYLLTWYGGAGLVQAQTVAFVTWLLGHVLLALNLRSERQPLAQLGLLSNRLMNLWGAATIIFILAATLVPGVQAALKVTSLTANQWVLVAVAAFIGTFWIEALKLINRHETSKSTTPPVPTAGVNGA
jgi:Ca2+-transporting ATPase